MALSIPNVEAPEIEYKTPGGNKGAGAVARTNATNAAIYANAQNAVGFQKGIQDYYLDKLQADVVADIQDDNAKDQYRSVMQQRDIQIQSQLQAYQRNSENIATQLRLNREAALRADRQSETVLQDRLKQESYKLEELNLARSEDVARSRADFKTAKNAYKTAEQDFLYSKAFNEFQVGADLQELSYQESQNKLDFVEQRRAQKDKRDALIRESQRFTSDAQYQFSQADRQFTELESLESFKRDSLDREFQRFRSGQNYVRAQALQQFENQRADALFNTQQRMMKEVQDLGQVLSRGQRGRSAARGAQAVAAMAGIDIARFSDQINRAEDVYTATKDRVREVKQEQRKERKARKARSFEVVEQGAGTRDDQQARLQERVEEQTKENRAQYRSSVKAEKLASRRRAIQSKRNEDERLNRRSLGQFVDVQSSLKRDREQVAAKTQMDLVSTITGLKQEAFSMDRRALGESMLSAVDAYESSKDDIWLKKMEADMKAYSSRMFEPQFTDAPKQPFKTPRFQTFPPTVPLEVPRGAVAPRPEAPKQSGLSKVLQIGGLVVGALAAPFTAGGSVAAAAAFAGVGAGLSATSAFV